MVIIGIDPGVKTGYAEWDSDKETFIMIQTLKIHEALESVSIVSDFNNGDIFVRVEDARLRKWFGKNAANKQQGAGSIKRDCKIWEDYLKDKAIPYEMVHPIKGSTKFDKKKFEQYTKYSRSTSEHGRDAAMLVYKFKKHKI